MSNTVMPTDGFYKYLAQRIITQAIKDYQDALKKKNGKLRTDVERFVYSKWFDQVADTAGFGYCDFTARGKKSFCHALNKTITRKNNTPKRREKKTMDTSRDIEMFKEWLATVTPMQVIKFLFVFVVYYILAALFMVA